MSLHAVHHDPPLACRVDGSQGRQVLGGAGAEERLLLQLHQPVHAVVGVGQDVLVEGGHTRVVVLNGVGDIVGPVTATLSEFFSSAFTHG